MQQKYFGFLSLVILAFGSLTARAQADFQPGYVVRPAGDTVRGEIDYRDARFNATQCRFRVAPGAAVETFSTAQLTGYGLRNEHKTYRALAVPTPDSAAGPAPRYFFEALVSGPGNLYFLRDAERVDHLYAATPSLPLTELIYRKVRVEREGQTFLEEQATFRTTLALALRGCAAAQSQLPTLTFDARSLARVVRSYNNCQAPLAAATPASEARREAQGPRPRLGVLLGAKQTRLRFRGDYRLSDTHEVGPDTAPVVGIALSLPLTSFSRKLSLEADLFYETQRYSQLFESQPFPNYRPASQVNFDLAYLRIPLLLRYTFPKGLVRPFLEAGPTLAYAIKQTNSLAQTNSTGKFSPEEQLFDANGGFRAFEQGVSVGAGLQTQAWQQRRLAGLVRYEWSNGFSGYTGVVTNVRHAYVLLTLDLFK
jgi:hypothetical protein